MVQRSASATTTELRSRAREPQLLKAMCLEPVLINKKMITITSLCIATRERPPLTATRKSLSTATETQHNQKKKKKTKPVRPMCVTWPPHGKEQDSFECSASWRRKGQSSSQHHLGTSAFRISGSDFTSIFPIFKRDSCEWNKKRNVCE